MRTTTTETVAPVRRAITSILRESTDWRLTFTLYDVLGWLSEGLRPSAIIQGLPEITGEAHRMRMSDERDLADKLDRVAWMLRGLCNDIYFSIGNSEQESDYVEQSS